MPIRRARVAASPLRRLHHHVEQAVHRRRAADDYRSHRVRQRIPRLGARAAQRPRAHDGLAVVVQRRFLLRFLVVLLGPFLHAEHPRRVESRAERTAPHTDAAAAAAAPALLAYDVVAHARLVQRGSESTAVGVGDNREARLIAPSPRRSVLAPRVVGTRPGAHPRRAEEHHPVVVHHVERGTNADAKGAVRRSNRVAPRAPATVEPRPRPIAAPQVHRPRRLRVHRVRGVLERAQRALQAVHAAAAAAAARVVVVVCVSLRGAREGSDAGVVLCGALRLRDPSHRFSAGELGGGLDGPVHG